MFHSSPINKKPRGPENSGALVPALGADGLTAHVSDVGEAFAAFNAAGVPVGGAQVHGPTLEDAFIELTGKEYAS